MSRPQVVIPDVDPVARLFTPEGAEPTELQRLIALDVIHHSRGRVGRLRECPEVVVHHAGADDAARARYAARGWQVVA